MNEHEFEPVKGLPSALPEGEHLVWQGSPRWQSLAVQVLHIRKIAIYFFALISFYVVTAINSKEPLTQVWASINMQLLVGFLATAILIALSIAYSRTTIYTVTNRRVVFRFGLAVQMMINIPWERIDRAGLCEFSDGTGDILLEPNSAEKISYWILWPHARPWKLTNTQPLLRCLPDANEAATHISNQLRRQVEVQQAELIRSPDSTPNLVAAS